MTYSLYINGVYEDVLEEIRKAQAAVPELVCYLQPYASDTIVRLADSPPTKSEPVTLYASLTSSLPFVSYRAEIIGWENKETIPSERLAELSQHIKQHQPGEAEIYMVGGNGKPSINLISVVNVERLQIPILVSSFVKLSNNEPLKPRSRSGGWSYVKELPEWVGSLRETALEEAVHRDLKQKVVESLNDSQELRTQRLQSASKYPEAIQTIAKGFRRNPDVIAEVLLRAKGKCEQCGKEAPFKRVKDGTPYLEVHHRAMLSEGGEDTVKNAIAVCPNCHRKLHYGVQ
ncbi:HNH endonuclease [Marinobacter zhanjiangensis]|uniref:HNH nuclease domain-containing protein n=1 Tax=Marinobacter zhanjiangensis TaxID=578215 RepID=A0ABQ3BAN1_9GAMM|nr:HNH endonuclease [Marinobacter zhanjiangensis]GGY86151.1 hypothetical protein GCM10007071_37090 [Marinobacter zhanjiangensis]